MPVIPFKSDTPQIGKDCFIAPNAWITGSCVLGDQVSVFFGAVLRGDINAITVGSGTNIQEHALLHTSTGRGDCIVGQYVTVGHRAIIHGAQVNDYALIGMGATLLDGAVIGANAMIGAHSLVTADTIIPEGVLALGSPAKVKRDLTTEEIAGLKQSATHYITVGAAYREYFNAS